MLNWIFGANKYRLDDAELGAFNSFKIEDKVVHWVGNIPFLGGVPLEITGNPYGLDLDPKNQVLQFLAHEQHLAPVINFVLEEAYCVGGASYDTWNDHFWLTNLRVENNLLILTVEELRNPKGYHLFFEGISFLKMEPL